VDRDLEAMFDDLAAPERPDMIDAEPQPPAAHEPKMPEPWGYRDADPAPIPVEADDVSMSVSSDPEDDEPARPAQAQGLQPDDIDAIARAVVSKLSERVLREIAWDVVPDLADIIVRERIRELERESS
jgi:hypothetical protein